MNLPLEGITVLEFSQYLAGPYAGLRLADLGARVIKVERPVHGDACRQLATKNMMADGDSLVFHTINRNKESYTADLKSPDDLAKVKQLIACADVMTHNFRPGVMEKIGLDYSTVSAINPNIIYGEVTGYGTDGPWSKKPGQDLLAQAVSGLTWLTGSDCNGPIPFGMAVGDMICGTHFAQGLLAAIYRRVTTGTGARVEVSLLESLLDLQFEGLTASFTDNTLPQRSHSQEHAHAYLAAPYGIFATNDGFIALAMGDLTKLSTLLSLPALAKCQHSAREVVNACLRDHLKSKNSGDWLDLLEASDYWCSDVFDYQKLTTHEAFTELGMRQTVARANGSEIETLRCPVRIDGQRLMSRRAAPELGNATEIVNAQLADEHSSLRQVLPGSKQAASERPLPLEGITVVDFSQFLSGPSASLRLADLGATVIKVEQPITGDICRDLYASSASPGQSSAFFRAINRNKQSVCLDLKEADNKDKLERLIKQANVVMHNFRPGVATRLGIGKAQVQGINPSAIYGEISGYGSTGPWCNKPGQDLLLQSISGMTWLSGNADTGPIAMGLAVVDIFSGAQLAQGLMALLVQQQLQQRTGSTEVIMLESALDFQFEPLTLYFQDGGQEPQRTKTNGAHAYLGAPYGIYQTADGYLALAMASIPQLGELLACSPLLDYPDPKSWFDERDELKKILATHLKTRPTAQWLEVLEAADIWCAKVHDWHELQATEAYQLLEFEQVVEVTSGETYKTTRCPIRLDGKILKSAAGAPSLGEHNCLAELS